VSKKHKYHSLLAPPPERLRERVERAVQEGRFQQALELGKQLCKQEPSPVHQQLLKKIYFGRAEQLRRQGHDRDAQTVLGNLVPLLEGDPAALEKLARELARCGAVGEAMKICQRMPESPARNDIMALAADWSLQQGAAGRSHLPESMREPFDAVIMAFRQLEAGQLEQVGETLQRISLQSPFLEWKVLLRGFVAHARKDGQRATENWQRLDAGRLPARPAAPFRFQVDRAFRDAQPPEMQNLLRKQADRLPASGLLPPLRALQSVLAHPEQLAQAFRLAENLLPALRQQAPHLVPPLAACFFWTMVDNGQPEDALRYQRVFGAPADDPKLARLRALLFEHMRELQEAHACWQEFEREVSENRTAWPEAIASHVRALVWWRMGQNAASIPDEEQLRDLPPFLKGSPYRPKPLMPSAEECFRKSLELNPNQLVTHEALFQYHFARANARKAEQAARRLLEHFPDHVPTLEALADLLNNRGDHAGALGLLQHAVKINPLDRKLRSQISTVHLFHARSHAENGRFDQARAEYQAAQSYGDRTDEFSVQCKWAACEFKAGAPDRAEELLHQAQTQSGSNLTVAYTMLIETIRLKLPRALKSRFEGAFKSGLAEPPTAREAVQLAQTATSHRIAGISYHGQKTHEKKVLAYVDRARQLVFTEDQLEELAQALVKLQALKQLRQVATRGQQEFSQNPIFYLLEAEGYYSKGPFNFPGWKVRPLLARARELVMALPPGERRERILEKISQRQEMARVGGFFSSPDLMGAFEEFLERGGYGMDEDDEFEDDRPQ